MGTDLCILNNTCIYIIDPKIKKYDTSLKPHTDVWTGNSVDSIHLNTFITNANKENSLAIFPGSHLLGLLPVKNRKIDEERINLKIKPILLDNIKSSEILIFHPLLIHSTITNPKNKKLRIAIGDRVKCFDKKFTSQEASLGYRVINIGPINHIKRVIGNDYLEPFRVYGGKYSISEALQEEYDLLKLKKKDNFLTKYINASRKK